MATFTHGKSCPVSFTPAGGSENTIRVTNHSWKEIIDAADLTDSGASGIQQLIAGILRGDGSMRGNFDSDSKYYDATRQIRAGVSGVIKHYVSATLYYTIPVMITEVQSLVPVNDKVEFEAAVKLNGLAGSYSYPS